MLDCEWHDSFRGAVGSPKNAVEFVRPAGAGQHLGKTRTPALLDWKSVAAAAPVCGETPTADFAISGLVRTRVFMSSMAVLGLMESNQGRATGGTSESMLSLLVFRPDIIHICKVNAIRMSREDPAIGL